jgi:integrase
MAEQGRPKKEENSRKIATPFWEKGYAQRQLEYARKRLGESEAVTRFLDSYGNVNTKKAYALTLIVYLRWLREAKGVNFAPDELLRDNLVCIYKSDPVDVGTKAKHKRWLEEYVNSYMVREGYSEISRMIAVATVKRFYELNECPYYGVVKVSKGEPVPPPPALPAEDVRRVLKALPPQLRTPLLCEWQSACEINRVLTLRWGDVDEGLARGECPLKLQFFGRKGHRRPYHTYLGRDSVEALRLWRERWVELAAREPHPDELVFISKGGRKMDYGWLNRQMRKTALRLARQKLVQNGDPASCHSHALRHSFKGEAEHAGIKSGMVEFFMGHTTGLNWVYDNRDEVHQEDFLEAYRKLEPHISLDYTQSVLTEQFEEERKSWITEIAALRAEISRLAESKPRGS